MKTPYIKCPHDNCGNQIIDVTQIETGPIRCGCGRYYHVQKHIEVTFTVSAMIKVP